jgi:hypothetical protein
MSWLARARARDVVVAAEPDGAPMFRRFRGDLLMLERLS